MAGELIRSARVITTPANPDTKVTPERREKPILPRISNTKLLFKLFTIFRLFYVGLFDALLRAGLLRHLHR